MGERGDEERLEYRTLSNAVGLKEAGFHTCYIYIQDLGGDQSRSAIRYSLLCGQVDVIVIESFSCCFANAIFAIPSLYCGLLRAENCGCSKYELNILSMGTSQVSVSEGNCDFI